MKRLQILLTLLVAPLIIIAQRDSTDIIVKNSMLKQKIVGMSLAVVKNGKTLVNKGYGWANAELNVAAKPETVFRLASISKQFFTTAILVLQQDGLLSTEDSIHKFFPDAPETWRPIQLKHLMSHSSGLKRESPVYDNFKTIGELDIIKAAYPLALDFKTGEKYQYCNLGYYMIAQIITQVSGKKWDQYIHEKLFVPAGMNNSYLTDFYDIIPNRASGYVYRKDTLLNATTMFAIRPSGGFLSTTTDMIKWEKVLREKKIILKKESWEKLWQPFIKTSDKPGSKNYYGFGWTVDEVNGRRLVSHSGSNIGFKTHFSRFIDNELSIIILSNTENATPAVIINELAAYYLRKKIL